MGNVRIAKTFLKKMKEPVLISPVINSYYKATVIKIVCFSVQFSHSVMSDSTTP